MKILNRLFISIAIVACSVNIAVADHTAQLMGLGMPAALAKKVGAAIGDSGIFPATADGSDSSSYCVGGGGSCDLTGARGAVARLYGNENANVGASYLLSGTGGGAMTIGTMGAGAINVVANGSNALVVSSAGAAAFTNTVTSSRTTDLGWAVVDGTDNTACNTQCTSAAVFGFDLSGGATAPVIKGPSDATSDICLCAGAS